MVRPFRLPPLASPSQLCDATARSSSPVHQRAMRESASLWIVLSVSPKTRSPYFVHGLHSTLFHWARLRGNSCARRLRVFCFSVSSQKLFANDSEDFLCPSRNADSRLG